LLEAFELADIQLTPEAPLVVHAVEPHGMALTSTVASTEPCAATTLRVRRFGTAPSGPMDWACEVTVDLAAWMLMSPAPTGTVLDAFVPAAFRGGPPRLGRAHGLLDMKHIWIVARSTNGGSVRSPAALQAWTDALLEAMRLRWAHSGAACQCC
jgi:hypothetical protein